MFDPPLRWLNDARYGVDSNVKGDNGEISQENVTMKFDGAIVLTDGYASSPTIEPYCRLMWVITPSGTDEHIRETNKPYAILKLPPYDKR